MTSGTLPPTSAQVRTLSAAGGSAQVTSFGQPATSHTLLAGVCSLLGRLVATSSIAAGMVAFLAVMARNDEAHHRFAFSPAVHEPLMWGPFLVVLLAWAVFGTRTPEGADQWSRGPAGMAGETVGRGGTPSHRPSLLAVRSS